MVPYGAPMGLIMGLNGSLYRSMVVLTGALWGFYGVSALWVSLWICMGSL